MKVTKDGPYSFRSINVIYTFGCLYDNTFDLNSPLQNELLCDHNGNSEENNRFLFTQNLYTDKTYTLVVTTNTDLTTGSYFVEIHGPSWVNMTSITPKQSM